MNQLDPLGVFDDPGFAARALDTAPTYQNNRPFPHAVFDDFIPADLARTLGAAFPAADSIQWVERDNENNRRRYQHDETKVPPLLRSMLREMNSRQFILFLETLTGIDNLLPDPYFLGGGVHISGTGDFLNVHVDFNWNHKLQAYRRVNALLYLSEQWEPEWQGALEFWDQDRDEPTVSVLPMFNRLIVFSTGETSLHGQRLHNLCPPTALRKVLNLYYYTTHRDDGDQGDEPHFTVYRTAASPFATQLGDEYRASATESSEHSA